MANAVNKISLQRGYAISSYVLNAFGVAGVQYACLVAESLGMKQVYLHPFVGVFPLMVLVLGRNVGSGKSPVISSSALTFIPGHRYVSTFGMEGG
jgi:hypothetical protein